MATGSVNIGGGGGIKKIYTLYRQEAEPSGPKQGDMWVVPIKETSKVTISLDVPAVPIDGELLLQFTNVAYSFDFQEISSKIDGNLNTTQYVYDISSLMKVTLNNNFIGLFQKDVVKEYGVLKRISQFNSSTSLWETPIAYYYNGSEWVNMHYKIFTQATTGIIEKRLPKTNAISETISSIPKTVVRVMPNGNYYVKTKSGYYIVLSKYKADGTFISSFTFTNHGTGSYIWPTDVLTIDDMGFVYILYNSTTTNTFDTDYSNTNRSIKKFNADTGEHIYTTEFVTHYVNAYIGSGNGKLLYVCDNSFIHSLNMADGVVTIAQTQTGGYNILYSNPIFEEDGFWLFADTSTTATVSFRIVKMRYTDLSFIKTAINEGQQVGKGGNIYVKGMGYNSSDLKLYLFKHPTDLDTFVVIFNGVQEASINGLKVNFSTGLAIPSKYMVSIPMPAEASTINQFYTIMTAVDDENIIDIAWYNRHYKYSMDGVLLDTITTSLLFPSYRLKKNSGFHSYYRG